MLCKFLKTPQHSRPPGKMPKTVETRVGCCFLYYLYYKSGRSGPEASWMKASISRVQHLSLW